jgi:FkbM family methyltransferase
MKIGGIPLAVLFSRETRRTLGLLDERRRRRPITTDWGFQFIGPEFLTSGRFEPEETHLVRELLKDVDILVNVGAHMGYYCCHALQLGKRVIAVEPNLENTHYLMRNIQINGWSDRAEIFVAAVGGSAGILEMWGSGTAASLVKGWAGNGGLPTQVPILTLDRIAAETIQGMRSLFIVDVEGYEHLALRGGVKCLGAIPRPMWMVEIMGATHRPTGQAYHSQVLQTFSEFLDRGYECKTVEPSPERVDIDRVRSKLEAASFGCHNFLFS